MQPAGDRRGFALLSVLWIVVLVAVVGLDFSLRTHGMAGQVMNRADHSIARAAAGAAVLYAREVLDARLREMETSPADVGGLLDPWIEPGALVGDSLQVGQALCSLTLRDVGRMLHLNQAGEAEIRQFMIASGIDAGDADRLAQTITDWRDRDDFRRARGAERDDYVRADAPVLPANSPFGSVEDLMDVQGITPEIFARLKPLLTIAGSGRVNISVAPAEVISGLPGMSPQLLRAILEARGRGLVPNLLTLTVDVDEDARASFNRDLAALMARVTNSTEEVLISTVCTVPGSAVAVGMSAVAARARGAVSLVERSWS